MSTIYQSMYFRLVLGFIILLSIGLLYYVIQTRGKIIEGNTGSAAASAPASTPAAGVASSISTTPGQSSNLSTTFQRDDGGKPTITFTGLRTAPPSGEVKTETIFYVSVPTELMVDNYKTLAIVNTTTQAPSSAVTYAIDDVINICDSTVVSDLFFSDVASALINRNSSPQTINTVKQCVNENKIKIIATHTALPAGSTGLAHTFKIQGFKIPVVSPLQLIIETVAPTSMTREVKDLVIPAAPTANFVRPTGFTDSTFKIELSDTTPGMKNITAKYAFKFTSSATDFVIEKDDSVIYFIFSSDFVLPPIENVKVAINNVLLDAGKNEYVLQHKTTCITPGKDSSLFVDSGSYKFESENKICINIYMLYLKQNLTVASNEFTVALKGLTNPSYSPPPVAYDKKDFLFRAFNTSYCIMNLKIRTLGRYLFNPKSDDYIRAGFYMRGNYPLKNVKPVEDENSGSGSGENSGDSKMKSDAETNNSIESRGGSARAANVHTVNYFYDGQGQGEYGYIARPDIFGTTPYSYGTSRGGAGTSDKYAAKHKRDLEEEKRITAEKLKQWKASQISPPMGVAPALLNAGVQPYDSSINF